MFSIKQEGALRTCVPLLKGGCTCSLGGITGEQTGDRSVLGDITGDRSVLGDITGDRSSSTGSIGGVIVIGGSLVSIR